jgi:hypothetical protein
MNQEALDYRLKQAANSAVRQFMKSSLRQDVRDEILRSLAVFSGLGLVASLIALSYGIDLSPGFF